MFLFKNSRNKVTRIGLNLLVYSLVLCVVLLVASSWITSMYRLWDSVYQIGLIGVFVGVFVSVVGLGLPKTPNASSDLKPSSSVRLKEGYDGKFTEFYLDLCQENGTFFIKKISYHYNAGRTDLIKEIVNLKISFGDITLPHGLFRVILLEQIYRAFKINNNERYHK